jgi:hypothetical protein
MWPRPRFHGAHQLGNMKVQSGVPGVVEDVQAEDAAPLPRDVPIAEVPAEQLGIRGAIEVGTVASWAGRLHMVLAPRIAPTLVLAPPAANRLDGDAVECGVLGVWHAGI